MYGVAKGALTVSTVIVHTWLEIADPRRGGGHHRGGGGSHAYQPLIVGTH
jgi:hypothetical protein